MRISPRNIAFMMLALSVLFFSLASIQIKASEPTADVTAKGSSYLELLEVAKTLQPDEKLLVWIDINATVDRFGDCFLPADPSIYGIKWVAITFAPDMNESGLFWCLAEVETRNIQSLINIPWVFDVTLVRSLGLSPPVPEAPKLSVGIPEAIDRTLKRNETLQIIAWVERPGYSGERSDSYDKEIDRVITNATGAVEQHGGRFLKHYEGSDTLLVTLPPENITRVAESSFIKRLYLNGPLIFCGFDGAEGTSDNCGIMPNVGLSSAGSISLFSSIAFLVRDRLNKRLTRRTFALLCVAMFFSSILMPQMIPRAQALDVSTSAIGASDVWASGNRGGGVNVALIDSGIDLNHPDFAGAIVDQFDIGTLTPNVQDTYGHGTHVAGIVAGRGVSNPAFTGIAPQAGLVVVRAIDDVEFAAAAQWIIDHRIQDDVRIIQSSVTPTNVGLGGDGLDSPYAMALDDAVECGIVVIQAAGNSGSGSRTTVSPANAFNVITVGAVDDKNTGDIADDTLTDFSSRGPTGDDRPKPDVVAPGMRIISCRDRGTDLRSGYDTYIDQFYIEMTGTSMAAPHVSGTAALMLHANPDLTPAQVKAALRQTARLNDDLEGRSVNERGHGIIDAFNAVLAVNTHDIHKEQMYDSWAASTPTHDLPWNCYDYLTFTVNPPSSQGISMDNIDYHLKWLGIPIIEYRLLKQEYVRDIWIDGIYHNLGDEMGTHLLSGPRVYAKGPGYLVLRAKYIIGGVYAVCYWDMTQNGQDFWIEYVGGSTWKTLMFINPEIWDSSNYAFLNDYGPTVLRESRIADLPRFYIRNLGSDVEYLKVCPDPNEYTAWLLKHGYTGTNPDEPSALNSEYIYNRDIDIYLQMDCQHAGVVVFRVTDSPLPPPENRQNDAGTGADAGNSFPDANSIDPGSYSGILCNSDPNDMNDYYKFYVKSGYSIKAYMVPPLGIDFDLQLYDPNFNLKAASHNGPGLTEVVANGVWPEGWWAVRVYIVNGEAEYSFNVSVYGSGDVNRDDKVDIYDAILLAGAFNTVPGSQTWNNAADLNGDNLVDIYDALILASNFGKHYSEGSGRGALGQPPSGQAMTDGGVSVSLAPSQVTVFKDEVFTVNVNVASVTDLQGWEFKLYWNSTMLNCTNAAVQTPIEWLDNAQTYGPGLENGYNATHARFWKAETAAYPAPSFNGSMTLATLTFQALQPGTTSLTLTDVKLGNSTGQPIDCTASSGSVTTYYGRYMRSDTQQVNGLSAYKLKIPQSTGSAVNTQSGSGAGALWGIRAWVRHSNGVEQEISLDGQTGTPKALVGGGSAGIKSSTVSVAQTGLQSTDSLVVRVYVSIADGPWSLCATFTTEQLQSSTLKATVWTVYYYTSSSYNRVYDRTTAKFYWGTTTYNSRIQNLQFN